MYFNIESYGYSLFKRGPSSLCPRKKDRELEKEQENNNNNKKAGQLVCLSFAVLKHNFEQSFVSIKMVYSHTVKGRWSRTSELVARRKKHGKLKGLHEKKCSKSSVSSISKASLDS